MNPAALKVHQKDLIPGGTIIMNTDAFSKKNLSFAGYETNPVDDGSLDDYFTVIPIEMNKMVTAACDGMELSTKLVLRTKNFFALGVLFYMYDRPLDATEAWLKKKVCRKRCHYKSEYSIYARGVQLWRYYRIIYDKI